METDKYREFLKNNNIKVNKYLNMVLLFFIITGPAIALGIRTNVFPDISYITCLNISAGVAILSAVHLLLRKKYPTSAFTSLFVLTALDILILYMSYSHVSIYLTWFLVPLLSLLYCNKKIYTCALIVNYILMFIATWLNAPYYAQTRTLFNGSTEYFLDTMGGFTIENIIMFAGGYIICRLTVGYFKDLFRNMELIEEQEAKMEEKMDILASMSEIYDNVNLINFVNNTEMSLRDSTQTKHGIDMTSQTHTLMNQRIKNQVMPDQLDEFLTFTNIKTVRTRLSQKKIISADFIDVETGWFRAQYITVDSTLDGIPKIVIYTTRNVDDEKRREEHLIRISMTDEMTRLFNRRCYDEDLAEYRKKELSEDFVLFSIDVNGLKTVNDTKGHAAGDELIKAAANCMVVSVGSKGKIYRTGGDEFMAVVHTNDPEELRKSIYKNSKEWKGVYTDKLSMSVGYAKYKGQEKASIDELEHLADVDMYREKDKYYRENKIDRRRQR